MAVVEFLDLIVVFAVNDFGICLLVSADQAEDQGLEALAVGCVGIDEAAELRSGNNDFQVVGSAELLEGIRDIVAVSSSFSNSCSFTRNCSVFLPPTLLSGTMNDTPVPGTSIIIFVISPLRSFFHVSPVTIARNNNFSDSSRPK